MQPRTLALLVTILPLFAVNLSYIISAGAELVPRCIPYIEGCTSISRAVRQGEAVFLFRASMIVNAIILILYWRCAKRWLDTLRISGAVNQGKMSSQVMSYLGIIGAFFLILYADYIGTSGEVYRFMRRYGVIFYFTFTPLAQMIMVNQLYKIRKLAPNAEIKLGVLRYQLTILIIILLTGLISLYLSYTQGSNFVRENIIEWNFALLITAFFGGSIVMWKNLTYKLSINSGK